jgi:hypothetical protein
MAQQVVVVDDITGEAGASTRRLRLDGVEYDIDLTDESFASLQEQCCGRTWRRRAWCR